MREEASIDHLSVGMRRPTGEYERPILGARLFWTKPGTLVIITLITITVFRDAFCRASMRLQDKNIKT